MIEILPLDSIIQFLTALAALAVIALLWKNRKAPEVTFLILIELNAAIWAFFYASEFATPVLQSKIIWSQLSYLGIAFLPVNFLFFVLAFSRLTRFISFKYYLLASIIPLLTIVMVISNPRHHLVWETISLPEGSNIMYYVHGPWFWTYWGYAFLLISIGLFNLIRLYFKFGRASFPQITILLLASLIPIIGNIAYVSGLNPYEGFDWTTTGFVMTGLIIAVGVYRHQMFEILPLATQKFINIINDGVIVVNNQGLIEDVNPATRKIFNLDGNSIIKSAFTETFSEHRELIDGWMKNEVNHTDLCIRNEGQDSYYRVNILPIMNDKTEISGKLVVVSDVTTIRQSEMKLKDRNEQLQSEIRKNEKLIADLDAFAHTVAHDLKNMLGAIYLSSDSMIDYLREGEFEIMKDTSVLIRESALKTIQITDELMKLATIAYQDVPKERVDMQQVFDQAKSQLTELIAERKATITTVKWETVIAYSPWLNQVWLNYLSNAIKYGGSPPEIKAGSEKLDDGRVKFWIRDNGDGIDTKHQQHLFEKHSRFHREKAIGYGIGLSIVKQVVEKMEGTVGVISSGVPGEGSEFYFILPASKEDPLTV